MKALEDEVMEALEDEVMEALGKIGDVENPFLILGGIAADYASSHASIVDCVFPVVKTKDESQLKIYKGKK